MIAPVRQVRFVGAMVAALRVAATMKAALRVIFALVNVVLSVVEPMKAATPKTVRSANRTAVCLAAVVIEPALRDRSVWKTFAARVAVMMLLARQAISAIRTSAV
jgi:hypothetical protein